MNIISNLLEYVKLKNVKLMFFGMEPDKIFPYTQIDVVKFLKGRDRNDIIENAFKGRFINSLEMPFNLSEVQSLR